MVGDLSKWFDSFVSYKLEGFGWVKEVQGEFLKFTSQSGAVRTCVAVESLDNTIFSFDRVCSYIGKENFEFLDKNWEVLKDKNIIFYFVSSDLSYHFSFNPKAHKMVANNKPLNKSLKLLEEHAKLK